MVFICKAVKITQNNKLNMIYSDLPCSSVFYTSLYYYKGFFKKLNLLF